LVQRRKYLRVKKICPVEIVEIATGRKIDSDLIDVSASGLAVLCSSVIEAGTEVELGFKLSPLLIFEKIRAKTVRTDHSSGNFRISIAMSELTSEQKNLIDKFVTDRRRQERTGLL